MKFAIDGRSRTFGLMTLLFLGSRAAHAATTYMVTPDLRGEINPLVSVFGAGWTGLLVSQVLLCALVIGLAYWETFSPPVPLPQQRGLDFSDFAGAYYFGRKASLSDYLWRSPKGWRLSLKIAGYLLPRVAIVLGFYVATSSYVSLHSALWNHVVNVTFPYIYFVPIALLTVWSVHRFLRREYRSYALSDSQDPATGFS